MKQWYNISCKVVRKTTMKTYKTLIDIKNKKNIKSKKDLILSLFKSGTKEIEAIAIVSGAKPSYVGAVLQKAGLIDNYFDLYTSTGFPMNVYTKYFRGKLGFKDVKTANRSIENLERIYQIFKRKKDRAGQHHTLEMGMLMLNRARWTGKVEEAEIYRIWLANKFSKPLVKEAKDNVIQFPKVKILETKEKLAA